MNDNVSFSAHRFVNKMEETKFYGAGEIIPISETYDICQKALVGFLNVFNHETTLIHNCLKESETTLIFTDLEIGSMISIDNWNLDKWKYFQTYKNGLEIFDNYEGVKCPLFLTFINTVNQTKTLFPNNECMALLDVTPEGQTIFQAVFKTNSRLIDICFLKSDYKEEKHEATSFAEQENYNHFLFYRKKENVSDFYDSLTKDKADEIKVIIDDVLERYGTGEKNISIYTFWKKPELIFIDIKETDYLIGINLVSRKDNVHTTDYSFRLANGNLIDLFIEYNETHELIDIEVIGKTQDVFKMFYSAELI